MSLFDINKQEVNEDIVSEIRRAWLIVWVHSYIYYKLGKNIINDVTWDKWAKRLVELIEKYPDEAKCVKHYDMFEDFDGSTGFIIASKATENLKKKANFLLKYS